MTVEPIRDKAKIKKMSQLLMLKHPKYNLMFKLGLNTGLRISDILTLKVKNVMNENRVFHEYLVLNEKKTGKEKKIKINDALKIVLNSYVKSQNMELDSYLFPGNNSGHLGRIQAYRSLKESAEMVGITNFGTHSLRKTWGYWTYKMSKYNVGLIMDTFNHSSQSITLKYIGINQDQKDELYLLVQF